MTVETDNGLFQEMMEEVFDCNQANGWFDADRTFGEDLVLLHSEVSEALEAYREVGMEDVFTYPVSLVSEAGYEGAVAEYEKRGLLPKPEGVGSELADVLVRLLDTCKRYDIDLFGQWQTKMAYNRTRGYRHGGKKL